MTSQHARMDDRHNLLTDDFVTRRAELVHRVQVGVERCVAAQLAAGHPVFSSGLRDEADRLFVQTPDGQCCEYHVRDDGVHEVVRDDLA